MAKVDFKDVKIEGITNAEKVLKEGIVTIITTGKHHRFFYRYAFTDKGVWMRSKKGLFFKAREIFMSYTDIDAYKEVKYFTREGFVFFPKTGRPGNMLFFDDRDEVEIIIKKFFKKREK